MKNVKILTMCMAFVSCSNNNGDYKEIASSSMEEHKSISEGTYLDLSFYHLEDKDRFMPAVFSINGVLFGPKKDSLSHILPVQPGQYTIKAMYIGKAKKELDISVEKGDSLVLKIYLEDDPQPLVD
ncbi:MAG TPA: hypothetical protein VFM80_00030 [Gracilimonas sp.]|uniref:hypothetical protein n=1 Tax=Gracilimonas sp. TaxID=1974203 RepID=UPI002D9FFC38|nr:hypothetical protein [Gracilimonas sp.]